MSVNIFNKSAMGSINELNVIATKSADRVYVGTKSAVDVAIKSNEIGDGSVVYITDDYGPGEIPQVSYAQRSDTANKALTSEKATNDSSGHNIASTFMPRGILWSTPLYTLPVGSRETKWTATEDCFMVANISAGGGGSENIYIYIDDVRIIDTSAQSGHSNAWLIPLPILKGQVVRVKSGFTFVKNAGCVFYKYIYK